MNGTTWYELLVAARTRAGISQAELAARSHVSLAAVKAYEQGRRHPSRPYLSAMLDCLSVERGERHAIFEAAGFAADAAGRGPWDDGYMLTLTQATAEIARYPWPSFVTDELFQVCAANRIALALLRTKVTSPVDGRLSSGAMQLAGGLDYTGRIQNVAEAFGAIASRYKGRVASMRAVRSPGAQLSAAIERFRAAGPDQIAPFLRAWDDAEPIAPTARWSVPLVWHDDALGEMRFTCLSSCISHEDGFVINDWMPADAATLAGLAALAAEADAAPVAASGPV